MSNVLYLLTGPTGVGKTEQALHWANKNNAEILSCDSLLFYEGMDIGTAKPSLEERSQIVHYGIDIVPIDRQFNIKDYIEFAKMAINSAQEKGKKLLIVGGSGFYLKSFLAPVVDDIEIPNSLGEEVLMLYENSGLDGLMSELLKLNPKGVGDLDIFNHRRVIKALARCRASGKTLLELKASFETQQSVFTNFKKEICILERDPDVLKKRIRFRVFEMLKLGLIDEVSHLMQKGIEKNPSAANAIGYRETIDWLKKNGSNEADLAEAIILNTNRLVAKQRKWFRTQIKDAQIINLDNNFDPNLLFSRYL